MNHNLKQTRDMSERMRYLVVLLVAFVGSVLLYGNTVTGDYVYDDEAFVTRYRKPEPQQLTTIWTETLIPGSRVQGVYRPLTQTSFWLNSKLFGATPVSHHVVSILLHGLCTVLVYAVIRQLFGDDGLAAITAALFLTVPIHTEAVAYIKARDELLSTAFFLGGMSLFIKSNKSTHKSHLSLVISSILFGLSALSKDFAFVWPFTAVAVYWVRFRPRAVRFAIYTMAAMIGPLMVLALRVWVLGARAFGVDINYFVINPLGYTDTWTRITTAFQLAFLYVSKTVWPYGLSATYHYNQIPLTGRLWESWEAMAGVVVLAGLGSLLLVPRFRRTPIAAGILLFLLPYAVFSKFLFKWGDMAAERWMYLPSLGLLLLLAYGFRMAAGRHRRGAVLLLTLLLTAYGLVTVGRNRVWLSKQALAESMLRSAPRSVMTYLQLAAAASGEGRYPEAEQYLAQGIRIYDNHPPLLELAAGIAYQKGNLAEARRLTERALNGQGKLVGARILQCLLLAKEGKYRDSMILLDQHLSRRKTDPLVRFLYALNWYKVGNPARAREYFDWDTSLSEEEKIRMLERF